MVAEEPVAELEFRVDSTADCEPQHFMFNTSVDFLDLKAREEVHQTLDRDVDDLAGREVSQQPGGHQNLILGTGGRALQRVQEREERDRDTLKVESGRGGV